jgi:hypothetical protein
MRIVMLIGCLLCACPAAGAQTAAGGGGTQEAGGRVAVVKHSWSKDRVGWERDPFSGPNDSFGDVRRRAVDERRYERARGTGNIGEAKKIEQEMRAEQVIRSRPPDPPRYAFTYKATFRNDSPKAVREIDWDYVFLDAETGEELGRRQFTGVERIAPGKTKELVFLVPTPPSARISVHALGKNERAGMREEVVVVGVRYEDGGAWKREP